MDITSLTAFIVFIIIMTGSPGPGNLAFLAIGSSKGYRATLPLILAANLGDFIVMLTISFGVGIIINQNQQLKTIFTVISMAYMTYLAWKIIKINIHNHQTKNISFLESFLIHPLSPKTWAMGITAYGLYFTNDSFPLWEKTAYIAVGFTLGGFIFHSLWALVGNGILKLVGNGKLLKTINISMAILMLGVTAWSLAWSLILTG